MLTARKSSGQSPPPAFALQLISSRPADAWNRLVQVRADDGGLPGALIATYRYNGLNHRVQKILWDDADPQAPDTTIDYYHNAGWQVVEERVDGAVHAQYLWCPSYIDTPVLRWRDTTGNEEFDETLYYTVDANKNVTALIAPGNGQPVERYLYDPYGRVTVLDDGWNSVAWSASRKNEILFAGYRYNPETGYYHVRHREYHPMLGRWLQRDPLGYVDGGNLYEYVRSGPTGRVDYSGLETAAPQDEVFRGRAPRVLDTLEDTIEFYTVARHHFPRADGTRSRNGERLIDRTIEILIDIAWNAHVDENKRLRFSQMHGPRVTARARGADRAARNMHTNVQFEQTGSTYFEERRSSLCGVSTQIECRVWTGMILFTRPGLRIDLDGLEGKSIVGTQFQVETPQRLKGIAARVDTNLRVEATAQTTEPINILSLGRGTGFVTFDYVRCADGFGRFYRRGAEWHSDTRNQVIRWNREVEWHRAEGLRPLWRRVPVMRPELNDGESLGWGERGGVVSQRGDIIVR